MSNNLKFNAQPQSSRLTWILGGIAIVVIAALVIGGVVLLSKKNKTSPIDPIGLLNGVGVTVVGDPNASITLDIYEDPLCPNCAQLEQETGQTVANAVTTGKARVRYHLMNFLDTASASKSYSTRADAALQCVAATDNQDAWLKLHETILSPTRQPKENGTTDITDEQLAQLARQTGSGDEVAQCITSGDRVKDTKAAAENASESLSKASSDAGKKSSGTPTVLRNCEYQDLASDAWLEGLK